MQLKDSIKFLAKDSAVYGLAGAITKFLAIFTAPILTRVLTKGEYGSINVITSYLSVFAAFLILGQDSSIARFFYDKGEDKEYRIKIASIGFFIQVIATVIMIILFFIFGDNVGNIIFDNNKELVYYWKLGIIYVPASMLMSFSNNIFKWTFKKNKYLLITLGNGIFNVILTITLVVVFKYRILGVIFSLVISSNIFALLGLFLNREYISLKSLGEKDSFKIFKEMLKYGAPFTIVMIISMLMPSIDRTFLLRYVSIETIGEYAVSTRVSSLLLIVVSAFQIAFGPYLYSIWKNDDAPKIIGDLFRIYFLLLTVFAVLGVVFGDIIIYLFASMKYESAILVIPLLMLAVIIEGLVQFTTIGISWSKKTYYFLIVQVIGLISIFSFNFLLTQKFGVFGATMSLLLSRLIMNIIYYFISKRYYPLRYEFMKIFLIFLFSIFAYGASIYNYYDKSLFTYLLKYFIMILFFVLSFRFGFNKDERNNVILFIKNILG